MGRRKGADDGAWGLRERASSKLHALHIGQAQILTFEKGTVHQYQILGDHTEFVGLIFPGGWEEFFRFIGESYSGPMWPLEDDRNFFEVLLPKLKAAAEKFDMVPQPQLKSFDPQPWEPSDNVLPDGKEAYFLKHAKGPAYIAEGTVIRPLITTKQSGGNFAIGSIESSGMHRSALFQTASSIQFDCHHAFQVVEGKALFIVGEDESELTQWETLFVPAKTPFSFKTVGHASKMYAFSSGGGVVELLCKMGQEYKHPVLPEKEVTCRVEATALSQELGFVIA